MIAATSSFAGVQITKAVAAPKATGRVALVIEARRTKASAPSGGSTKVRYERTFVFWFALKYQPVARGSPGSSFRDHR
tara:strand:- start:9788 stop:10021 length:234 start_codon:yes stop_codon:yes gene_type:complete